MLGNHREMHIQFDVWDGRFLAAVALSMAVIFLRILPEGLFEPGAKVWLDALLPATVIAAWWLSTFVFAPAAIRDDFTFHVNEDITRYLYVGVGMALALANLRHRHKAVYFSAWPALLVFGALFLLEIYNSIRLYAES